MSPGVATKVIAASCACSAFAIGILAGLFAGNPTETILVRALIAMFVGNLIGMIVGSIGERTVLEAFRKYQKDRSGASVKGGESGAIAPEFSA